MSLWKGNIAQAVALRHTQGTDQGLDTGGVNAITVAQVKAAHVRPFIVDIQAGAFVPDPTLPPTNVVSVATGIIIIDKYPDAEGAFGLLQIKIPNNVDTAGTVIFSIEGFAETAAANKEVQMNLYNLPVAKGESWDRAMVANKSGDYVTDSTQNEHDLITWNKTVAALGWRAKDIVELKLTRTAIDGGTALVGYYCIVHLRIEIPRM